MVESCWWIDGCGFFGGMDLLVLVMDLDLDLGVFLCWVMVSFGWMGGRLWIVGGYYGF